MSVYENGLESEVEYSRKDSYVRRVSAAELLHPELKANRRVERTVRNADIKCPEPGAIIVFNQIERMHETPGRPFEGDRGIAKVVGYSGRLILLLLYTRPNVVLRTSFQISDIKCGLVQYRELTDYVYASQYKYKDLCLHSLHDDILQLLKK